MTASIVVSPTKSPVTFHNIQYFSFEELDAETLSDDIIFPDQLQFGVSSQPAIIPLAEGNIFAVRAVLHRGMFSPSDFDEGLPQYMEILMHVRSITTGK
ncbi:MAG: hypothetical protein GXY41_07045 [Phycisphaerae bacterium]|nr:hypothetical protein [Phycisphaerae bacterium]